MFSIGSVKTVRELEAESLRVLSIQDAKMRDIALSNLMIKAREQSRLNHSQFYYVKVEILLEQFSEPLLKIYFASSVYCDFIKLIIYQSQLSPYEPAAVDYLLSDFRCAAFTALLYSYLFPKNERKIFELLHQFPEFATVTTIRSFLEVSKGPTISPGLKLDLGLRLPYAEAIKIIDDCLAGDLTYELFLQAYNITVSLNAGNPIKTYMESILVTKNQPKNKVL